MALGSAPRSQEDPATWSVAQWRVWRDRRIGEILGSTVIARGRRVLSKIGVTQQSALSYLFLEPFMADPAFSGDPAKARTLDNFFAFVRTQSLMGLQDSHGSPDHALGFAKSDRDYWQSVERLFTLPPILTSQAFLRALEAPATYRAAIGFIGKYNATVSPDRRWITLSYRSQFLKSPDKSTYGRLLVYVPRSANTVRPDTDLWIQYAIESPNEPGPKPRSVSVVAVRAGLQPTAALSDFMRVPDSAGRISLVPTVELDDNPSKNCYECHKSAVLPIHPFKFIPIDAGSRVRDLEVLTELIDKRIADYKSVVPDETDADSYGPTLGNQPPIRANQLREIDPTLTEQSTQRILSAMSCTSCHGSGTVKVNFPAAILTDSLAQTFERGTGLAETYVTRGWMPPGNNLSAKERKALWRALDRNYLDLNGKSGALVDWLKGNPGAGRHMDNHSSQID